MSRDSDSVNPCVPLGESSAGIICFLLLCIRGVSFMEQLINHNMDIRQEHEHDEQEQEHEHDDQ